MSSYLCSLQVYIQEFGMCMRRLLGGAKHAKAKTKRLVYFLKRTALVSVLLFFYFKQHENLQKIVTDEHCCKPYSIYSGLMPILGYCHEPPRSTVVVREPWRSTSKVDHSGRPPRFNFPTCSMPNS